MSDFKGIRLDSGLVINPAELKKINKDLPWLAEESDKIVNRADDDGLDALEAAIEKHQKTDDDGLDALEASLDRISGGYIRDGYASLPEIDKYIITIPSDMAQSLVKCTNADRANKKSAINKCSDEALTILRNTERAVRAYAALKIYLAGNASKKEN